MRLAHIVATFPPYHGGTGNVCFYNARELARRGHEVHVFTPLQNRVPSHETVEGFYVHRLRPWLHTGNASWLPQLARNCMGFELIHLHYPFFGGEISAFVSRRHAIPFFITYHQDVYLSKTKAWIEKLLRFTCGRFTLCSADRLLFTSLDYALVSHMRPLLKGREMFIGELPNGVDTHKFAPGPPPEMLTSCYKANTGDQVALLVASLDQAHFFKGVDVFLKALVKAPPNIKAIIIGDGNLRHVYESMAYSLGLTRRVFFTGSIPDNKLLAYYRLADVTVLPSVTMGEAFGLVLLESMACGTPVIASNLPGVRTVVANGQDGYLVKPGDVQDLTDKLCALLSLPAACRQQMSAEGRTKAVQKYDWQVVVALLEKIYASVR